MIKYWILDFFLSKISINKVFLLLYILGLENWDQMDCLQATIRISMLLREKDHIVCVYEYPYIQYYLDVFEQTICFYAWL